LVEAPRGISWLVNGSGAPTTIFLPGLGGAIPHLRPLAGGVPGTRVFCQLDGDDAPDSYDDLAAAFRTAADACAATQALGVSLGAGVLLRLLSQTPDRFSRVVLFQPSALDVAPPERLADLETFAALGAAGQLPELAALLNVELAEDVRDARQSREGSLVRAGRLARPEGLRLLKTLAAGEPPVPDPSLLSGVTADVLVVAARDDEVHPVAVAERIASFLPRSEVVVFDHPAPLWRERAELRRLISGFLSA
jgi:3-oxoadipate enol-lactonase